MKGNKFSLLSQIIRGKWLIDPQYAKEMLPLVVEMLNGNPVNFYDSSEPENIEATAGYFMVQESSGRLLKLEHHFEDELPEGAVAVFNQRGVVMKEDFCGVAGTASMRSQFIQTMKSDKVISAIVSADTPGGAVNGTFELNEALYNCQKPTIGFADGLSASAGYLILSGCQEIHASHRTAEVGSIGVLTTLEDYSEHLKKLGVKRETFIAKTSPEKGEEYREAMKGNDEKLQAKLISTHTEFKNAVRRTRTEIGEESMKGSMYSAAEAVDRDMIDGIMPFEDVVERAMELGELMKNHNKKIYV